MGYVDESWTSGYFNRLRKLDSIGVPACQRGRPLRILARLDGDEVN